MSSLRESRENTGGSVGGPLSAELERAVELVRRAGEIAVRYHGADLGVELKGPGDPVTVADREASELITTALGASFPDDVIISEESSDDLRRLTAHRVWYVDPIDGTRDFIRGDDGYCVMIGLVIDGRPALGAVYQPTSQTTWFAATGCGAYRTIGDGDAHPIHCSGANELSELRLVVSKSLRDDTIDAVKLALGTPHETNIGSVGVKLGLLSSAAQDLYVTSSTLCSTWDTAAPEAILVEAGGRLTDVAGTPLRYDLKSLIHENGLLGSNGHVHDDVVRALAPIFSL